MRPEEKSEPAELSALSSADCHRLLGTKKVGRLGVVAENYPLIIPVNYGLDREVVVIRSRPGTKLSHADHANVTFQVDDLDHAARTGWSVLVRGQGEILTAQHDQEVAVRTRENGAVPWAPGEYQFWLRIIPHVVTGRRITPGDDSFWRLGTAAYM